jgi:hypothetical protein
MKTTQSPVNYHEKCVNEANSIRLFGNTLFLQAFIFAFLVNYFISRYLPMSILYTYVSLVTTQYNIVILQKLKDIMAERKNSACHAIKKTKSQTFDVWRYFVYLFIYLFNLYCTKE